MSDINTIIMSGRLANNPLYDPALPAVCHFTIVTTDDEDVASQKRNPESSIQVEVRGKFAEVCVKYLRKDREVIVSGKLVQTYWRGLVIIAKQVQFLGAPPTQDELAKPLQAMPPLDRGEVAALFEGPPEPFTRREEISREFASIGRYRIRMIKRDGKHSLDIREYISSKKLESFTTKGIRLTAVVEVDVLRDVLGEVLNCWNPTS
jgi:hypothetical protein